MSGRFREGIADHNETGDANGVRLPHLLVLLAGLGVLLWFSPDAAGLPSDWPSLSTLQQWLRSPSVPIEAIVPPAKLLG